MATVLCLGEALVDFVADVARVTLVECPGFRKAPGGAPANVAVALSRLGVEAAFLGKVGDDPFGRFLAETFAGAGVDIRFIRYDPAARTGLAFVSLQSNGERDFVFYRNPSADMLYRPDEVPEEALAGCRVFHFGSITLIQDPSRSATLETLRRAREQGAWISYDPNLRPPLWPDLQTARREIRAALPLADLLKVSEEEAELLVGPGTCAQQADRLLAQGPVLVAVTRGDAGSYLATAGASVELPAFPVPVVDTTGAGDGYVAGLIAELLVRNWSPATPLSAPDLGAIGRVASAVGALTCTGKGAIPSLPSREQTTRFLKDQPG